MSDDGPADIVGHKTMVNGLHVPLRRDEAEVMLAQIAAAKAKRAADMPTETDAIQALHDAYTRLKELGWRDAIYCPKDGTHFDAIEVGSTGIHDCYYFGDWPKGSWWACGQGDVWPSRPSLFRLLPQKGKP